MDYIATVVIPARGRSVELDRAIQSVAACKGNERVEIIVVDDCSPKVLDCRLRGQDRIIRLEKPSGAAVARNVGIDAAKGELIYLLDSDDYFIDRDFFCDHAMALGEGAPLLWFSEIDSQGFSSAYPPEVSKERFFAYVFHRQPHICQTSSLFFLKSCGFRFDESLPKHQDWDFVFGALLAGVSVLVYSNGQDRLYASITAA